MLPGGLDSYGNDVLPLHYAYYRPDVTLSLIDIWVMTPATLDKVPLAAWTPVDHNPIPPAVVNALKRTRWPVAMSRFGEAEMRRVGLSPMYVPHAVDTTTFTPKDRAKCREMWGVAEDKFLAVMVAANKGIPSRKSLDGTLKAWAKFTQTHPDALLYMHTEPTGAFSGFDLPQVARFYGLNDDQIRFPDAYRMMRGDYGWTALADLYNAADVLLSPSMGEGFGIPVVEAEASGCPVVVTDFTAQSELCFGGYKIPVDPFDDLVWTLQSSEQARIPPSKILAGIEWAFEHRGDEKLRQQAREGALDYDGQRVLTTYMLPALERIAEETNGEKKDRDVRTAQRLALRTNGAMASEKVEATIEAV